jgi:hypothetical protein
MKCVEMLRALTPSITTDLVSGRGETGTIARRFTPESVSPEQFECSAKEAL